MLVDQNWLCRYPRPNVAIFDNGSEFSSEFLALLQSYGITDKQTTVKSPQTNSFVELIIPFILSFFIIYQNANNDDNIFLRLN
jgi:hypothetical protein